MTAQDRIELFLGTTAAILLIGGLAAASIPGLGVKLSPMFVTVLSGLVVLFFGYKASDLSTGAFPPLHRGSKPRQDQPPTQNGPQQQTTVESERTPEETNKRPNERR